MRSLFHYIGVHHVWAKWKVKSATASNPFTHYCRKKTDMSHFTIQKSGNCLEYSRKNATFAAQEQIKNRWIWKRMPCNGCWWLHWRWASAWVSQPAPTMTTRRMSSLPCRKLSHHERHLLHPGQHTKRLCGLWPQQLNEKRKPYGFLFCVCRIWHKPNWLKSIRGYLPPSEAKDQSLPAMARMEEVQGCTHPSVLGKPSEQVRVLRGYAFSVFDRGTKHRLFRKEIIRRCPGLRAAAPSGRTCGSWISELGENWNCAHKGSVPLWAWNRSHLGNNFALIRFFNIAMQRGKKKTAYFCSL